MPISRDSSLKPPTRRWLACRHRSAGLILHHWVYITGPIAGAAGAVAVAFVLRGPGGGMSGSAAAQGALYTEAQKTGRGLNDRAAVDRSVS
jgi:hypothetical protein